MSLSLFDWIDQAKSRLKNWAANPKRALNQVGANSLYFGLAGAALYPIAEAVARNDLAALGLLYSLGAGVGVNLIANAVQHWADESDAANQLANAAPDHPELIQALDIVLQKVEAVDNAQAGLAEADRVWFTQTLRDGIKHVGSSITISGGVNLTAHTATITGDVAGRDILKSSTTTNSATHSAIATGGSAAATAGAVALNNNTVHGDVIINAGDKPPAGWREAYLGWVLNSVRSVPLAGVDPKSISEDTRADLDLAAVYTELLTQRLELDDALRDPRVSIDPYARAGRDARRLSALDVLNAEKHLALLGDPGSGKSTFVNFIALCLAGEGVGHASANLKTLTAPLPADDERARREQQAAQPQPWDHGALLPVRVVLRDFAARGLPPIGQAVPADHLWQFICAEMPASLCDSAAPLRDELRQCGGLLLLDGLDEVPEADQRREQVKAAVQGFRSLFARVRILVTSRTYAYQKQAWKLDGFAEAVLAPFERGQIQRFAQRWYAHIGPARHLTPEDAQGRAAILNAAIERSPRLRELAARPLLLTLMASLHAWRGGTLPDQREELYADAVQLLLDQWEGQKVRRTPDGQPELIQPSLAEWLNVDREQVRHVLNHLAFDAQREQADLTGTADIAQPKLVSELIRISTRPDARPNRLVEYLSERSGLLEPRGVGVLTFPHRTFQEYLAACFLTDHNFPDDLVNLVRAEPNRWREVALLAGAKASHGTAAAVWLLTDALCDKEFSPELARDVRRSESDGWAALIAAQVLIENKSLTHISERNQLKVERIRQWLTHTVTTGLLPPLDRVAAGRALGLIGDPRDFDEMIEIPAGKFWLGDETDRYSVIDNTPIHEINLPTYRIGKYPVTVKQWRQFVAATNYQGDPRTLTDPDNHPARWVSWRDAQAYCQWLTTEWRSAQKISVTEVVRLSTEAEWEKAARGDDRRAWPWGNDFEADRANTSELGAGTTSAVGCFPTGASPYGCLDMAGNVWEWTHSKDKNYPYRADDGREDVNERRDSPRVVRGGSWYRYRNLARCAYRDSLHPDLRGGNVGFRWCVVSPGSRS